MILCLIALQLCIATRFCSDKGKLPRGRDSVQILAANPLTHHPSVTPCALLPCRKAVLWNFLPLSQRQVDRATVPGYQQGKALLGQPPGKPRVVTVCRTWDVGKMQSLVFGAWSTSFQSSVGTFHRFFWVLPEITYAQISTVPRSGPTSCTPRGTWFCKHFVALCFVLNCCIHGWSLPLSMQLHRNLYLPSYSLCFQLHSALTSVFYLLFFCWSLCSPKSLISHIQI